MSGLFSLLGSTAAALNAQSQAIAVAGSNIAHVNDPNYSRETVTYRDTAEVQTDAGSLFGNASQQYRSEVLHEALAGPYRERSVELSEIELVGRPKRSFSVMNESTDGIAELERSGRCDQTATRPHEQRITSRFTQPRKGSAHR